MVHRSAIKSRKTSCFAANFLSHLSSLTFHSLYNSQNFSINWYICQFLGLFCKLKKFAILANFNFFCISQRIGTLNDVRGHFANFRNLQQFPNFFFREIFLLWLGQNLCKNNGSDYFHTILQFWAFKIVANLDFLVFLHGLANSGTFETIFLIRKLQFF